MPVAGLHQDQRCIRQTALEQPGIRIGAIAGVEVQARRRVQFAFLAGKVGFAKRGGRGAAETQGLIDPVLVRAQTDVAQEHAAVTRHLRQPQQPADVHEGTVGILRNVDGSCMPAQFGDRAPAFRTQCHRRMA